MTPVSDIDITLALDAMGGDFAPLAVLEGAESSLETYPNIRFLLVGDQEYINPLLANLPRLRERSTLLHTPDRILPEEKPSIALRQGKNSSMRLALEAVKDGRAVAAVSSGNTGALMAMAKLVLRTLPGIDRPAITAILPTLRGKSVMLDLGANVECSAENLFQFAVMGDAFARAVLGHDNPTIGLLNIGSEELKGHDTLKAAFQMLKETSLPLNFHGYIEGNDIAEGVVDIVVTDGFSGNIALKTAEGTAKICREFFYSALTSSLRAKIGAMIAKPALKKMSHKIDTRRRNGAMFVGLNGIAVKSHGSADAYAFSNAISVAVKIAAEKVNERIIEELKGKS